MSCGEEGFSEKTDWGKRNLVRQTKLELKISLSTIQQEEGITIRSNKL